MPIPESWNITPEPGDRLGRPTRILSVLTTRLSAYFFRKTYSGSIEHVGNATDLSIANRLKFRRYLQFGSCYQSKLELCDPGSLLSPIICQVSLTESGTLDGLPFIALSPVSITKLGNNNFEQLNSKVFKCAGTGCCHAVSQVRMNFIATIFGTLSFQKG